MDNHGLLSYLIYHLTTMFIAMTLQNPTHNTCTYLGRVHV